MSSVAPGPFSMRSRTKRRTARRSTSWTMICRADADTWMRSHSVHRPTRESLAFPGRCSTAPLGQLPGPTARYCCGKPRSLICCSPRPSTRVASLYATPTSAPNRSWDGGRAGTSRKGWSGVSRNPTWPERLARYLLQIAALHLVGNEVPGARRERHDGQPRILERGRGERCGVGQEDVLGVPTLIESIQDGRFRIVAHGGATALVDGRPRNQRAFLRIGQRGSNLVDRAVHQVFALEMIHRQAANAGEFRQRLLHVADHGLLVFAVRAGDSGYRNAPGIALERVELDEILAPRQHLANRHEEPAGLDAGHGAQQRIAA